MASLGIAEWSGVLNKTEKSQEPKTKPDSRRGFQLQHLWPGYGQLQLAAPGAQEVGFVLGF